MVSSGDPPVGKHPGPADTQRSEIVRLRKEIEQERRTEEFSVVLDGVSDEAWGCFVQSVRLEQGERDIDATRPEITYTMVRKALRKQRQVTPDIIESPIPNWVYLVRVSAILLTAGSGVAGSYLHSTWQWVVFTLICCAAIACNIVVVFGRSK
jgi:hypothetical protein